MSCWHSGRRRVLLSRSQPIAIFIATAYAGSVALSLLIGLTGGSESRLIGLAYVSMVIPALSALFAGSVSGDRRSYIVWDRLPLSYLPTALLLMPLVMHAVMLPVACAIGPLHWQSSPGAAGIAANAITGVVIVSAVALFEEIGWRGWLLPRLAEHMGLRSAVAVTSAIWAVWHVPYAFGGIHHLDGVAAAGTAIVVPAGIFGAGLVIGWFWLRTRSIWIVAIAHGALNNWGQYAFKFLSVEGALSDIVLLAAGDAALLAVGAILLTAFSPSDPASISPGER